METVLNSKIISIEWKILKAPGGAVEQFDRSTVRLFIIGANDVRYWSNFNISGGVVTTTIPANTLPVGVYDLKLIWGKNNTVLAGTRGFPPHHDHRCFHGIEEWMDEVRCINVAYVDGFVALTDVPSEETQPSIVAPTIKIESVTATYGYDGLSAYETAVMRDLTVAVTESEYVQLLAVRVEENHLADGAITTDKISDKAVTTAKLSGGDGESPAVTTAKIADGAVTEGKIGLRAVTTLKIADGNVTTAKIADKAVTSAKLQNYDSTASGDTGVTTAKIADGAVTKEKIASGAVTADKIGNGVIKSEHIAENSIESRMIRDEQILSQHIVNGAVTSAKIGTAAVTADKISGGETSPGVITNPAVTTDKIADGAVTSAKIGSGAVVAAKIGAGAVQAGHIGSGAVTEGKIAAGAVVEGNIAAGAVTEDKIADEAVTAGKIADGAVVAGNIVDEAITTDKIADNAVVAGNIADEAVTTDKIADGAVTTNKLAGLYQNGQEIVPGAVTEDKLADGAVTADKIRANAVGTHHIADEAVTTAKIANNTIFTRHIVDDAVTTDKIMNGNVTTAKIKDGAVTTAKIADEAVTSAKLADGIIPADRIAAGAVTTTKIADEAVTGDKLADGAVTSAKLADGLITELQTIMDDVPTAGSVKPVSSGGTHRMISLDRYLQDALVLDFRPGYISGSTGSPYTIAESSTRHYCILPANAGISLVIIKEGIPYQRVNIDASGNIISYGQGANVVPATAKYLAFNFEDAENTYEAVRIYQNLSLAEQNRFDSEDYNCFIRYSTNQNLDALTSGGYLYSQFLRAIISIKLIGFNKNNPHHLYTLTRNSGSNHKYRIIIREYSNGAWSIVFDSTNTNVESTGVQDGVNVVTWTSGTKSVVATIDYSLIIENVDQNLAAPICIFKQECFEDFDALEEQVQSLSEDALTISNLGHSPISDNLANPEDIQTDMYVRSDGVVAPQTGWAVASAPVVAGQKVTFGGFNLGRGGYYRFQDANGGKVSYGSYTNPNFRANPITLDVPATAVLLFIDIASTSSPADPYSGLQVNMGDTLLQYDEYKEAITSINNEPLAGGTSKELEERVGNLEESVATLQDEINVSIASIITDLPVSDGTDIEVGYAYIDSSTSVVKVKLS